MKQRLLFVCLGNICRSPAAEGIMQRLVIELLEDACEGLLDAIIKQK